jgi:hypothetical protein
MLQFHSVSLLPHFNTYNLKCPMGVSRIVFCQNLPRKSYITCNPRGGGVCANSRGSLWVVGYRGVPEFGAISVGRGAPTRLLSRAR